MSKKLINIPENVVDDCLEGLVAVNPGLRILEGHRVIVRADVPTEAVTLVSGGGAGHEPAHAGYIGPGMLSAAVSGAVFTSPPPSSILAAVKRVANDKGTILIIKNYTGDRLNFGIAVERARAAGLKVDMVVVGEDCALTSADKTAGRRGLAGTVFIHKIAGGMAASGASMDDIVTTLRDAAQNMGTIGLSLSPCSVPGSGPSFTLEADQMELGLGIHGEAGVQRMKVLPAKQAIDTMLSHMTKPDSVTRLDVNKGDSVALMVNNLGGTSVLELNVVAKEAIKWLEGRGIRVERAYCGSFMTALEMAGVSLTLMKLNDQRKKYLDCPTGAPGWQAPLCVSGEADRVTPPKVAAVAEEKKSAETTTSAKVDKATATLIHKSLSCACEALGNCERQLNELDTKSGDGDCGTTHKRGTNAIGNALGPVSSPKLPVDCPQQLLLAIAALVEQDMGGSSGAIYSLFLSASASYLSEDTSVAAWCTALGAGIDAIMKYGGAAPGDRTMLDAFYGAHNALKAAIAEGKTTLECFYACATAAERAAAATSSMAARAGRASYVSAEHLTQPDPGAHAVGIWMRAMYEGCKHAMSK